MKARRVAVIWGTVFALKVVLGAGVAVAALY